MSVTIDGTLGITSPAETTTNLAYTDTLTGGTGIVNLGSGQLYKDAVGNVGIGTSSPESAGLSIGIKGTVKQVLGGMANTNWCIRERDYVNVAAWSTNISDTGVQDDTGKASWITQQGYSDVTNDFWRVINVLW